MKPRGTVIFLALGLWGLGCASALHERPGLEGIGTAGGREATQGHADAMDEARAAWARRPDLQQVRRARELYLRAARHNSGDVDGLLGAARATAWLVEHVPDPAEREALAGQGVELGQLCLERAPGDARCRYRLALALGQQSRERPSTGLDGVRRMVQLLRGLTKDAPELDAAGPERVLALVLLRAPGWPTGPGDPGEGLEKARRAVTLAPADPRNHIVLAEALLAHGRKGAAKAELASARRLAQAAADAGNPDAPAQLVEIEGLSVRCGDSP